MRKAVMISFLDIWLLKNQPATWREKRSIITADFISFPALVRPQGLSDRPFSQHQQIDTSAHFFREEGRCLY
jgi:hypothetical protein